MTKRSASDDEPMVTKRVCGGSLTKYEKLLIHTVRTQGCMSEVRSSIFCLLARTPFMWVIWLGLRDSGQDRLQPRGIV